MKTLLCTRTQPETIKKQTPIINVTNKTTEVTIKQEPYKKYMEYTSLDMYERRKTRKMP